MNKADQVRAVLQAFQDGYTPRDLQNLDSFMELFVSEDELEVIGTGAVQPGGLEWCLGRAAVREIVASDWKSWGDLKLDVSGARIWVQGETAWLATTGTVTDTITAENLYRSYVEYMHRMVKDEIMSSQEKSMEILRAGTDMLHNIQRGEECVWPFRFTAVLVHRENGWLFHQIHFSHPTTRWPDERLK
jgi:hypothetical protein